MAPQKGQKPTEAQRKFTIPGAKTGGLRAARQIAKSRQFVYPLEDRPVFGCVSCLGPRERRSHPVCEACSARRKQGVR